MKVDRHVESAEEERGRVSRPSGHRISYTQLSTPCDLRLKFRRARVKVASPMGIGLLYGRAFHAGIEAYLRGAAKTPADAVRAAFAGLASEIAKNENSPGIRWDDYHERNLDGSVSLKGNNFGSLPDATFARWWLARQVPLWIAVFGKPNVRFSEKAIFVPMTRQPKWSNDWSVECWLDFVLDAPKGGYQITDTKTSAGYWDDRDLQKNSKQALLYMGAASREFGEPPELPFEFQVLARTKAAVPALEIAREWAIASEKGIPAEAEALFLALFAGGPPTYKEVKEGKGKDAVKTLVPILDEKGSAVLEWTVDDAVQRIAVAFDLAKINTYIQGVIRPRISLIEAEAFAANPSGWWCSRKFCDYWDHCAFGEGTNL